MAAWHACRHTHTHMKEIKMSVFHFPPFVYPPLLANNGLKESDRQTYFLLESALISSPKFTGRIHLNHCSWCLSGLSRYKHKIQKRPQWQKSFVFVHALGVSEERDRCTLFVKNLPPTVSVKDIKALSKDIKEVRLRITVRAKNRQKKKLRYIADVLVVRRRWLMGWRVGLMAGRLVASVNH